MVDLGSGNQREIDDLMLTRHACYLIAQELGVAQGAWHESGNLFFTIRPGFAPGVWHRFGSNFQENARRRSAL